MILSKIVRSSKIMFSSQKKLFSARNNLLNCFKQELEYEEKEYKPISEDEKKLFFNHSGFEFIESTSSARMELKKKSGEFDVTVCYHARSPMPEDEEANNEGPTNMVDFQLLINKTGQVGGFLVDAVVMDSQVSINAVHCAKDLKDLHSKFLTGRIDPDTYQGPDFSTLDESVQTAFTEFIAELGVNEECASFIEMSSLDKDQQLYMNWLKTSKNTLL